MRVHLDEYTKNFHEQAEKKLLSAAKLSPILWDEAIKYLGISLGYSSDSPGYYVLGIASKSIIIINKMRGNSTYNIDLNKINLEDNIDLMDEYNNEYVLDNNSENEIRYKMTSNESHTKILHDNSKNNENNTIINRINDNNIKSIKITKNDFLNKNKLIENKIESSHKNLVSTNMNEKLNFKNNKIYGNIKIKDYNPENESEDNFRKPKNKILNLILKGILKYPRKRKNYQSNEERKMKDGIPTLNKSLFNDINTLIPKNCEESMNSENKTNEKMQ
ncbi:hypothetical protein H8356DRAFT_1423380 [Neocallimastix lanati (nom. inval.)]|nr:hypothetical protein H8356DRAFT_1423380 [Neocallimastix sp. JGI-2020a]